MAELYVMRVFFSVSERFGDLLKTVFIQLALGRNAWAAPEPGADEILPLQGDEGSLGDPQIMRNSSTVVKRLIWGGLWMNYLIKLSIILKPLESW